MDLLIAMFNSSSTTLPIFRPQKGKLLGFHACTCPKVV
ncbi:hypothetical protein BVRB_4g097300 [Beta vulgaris subsp. vulgaris]|uniref:Uncharacterized protein n=1 Tax=Beta vulgaris subsp. vulgaris TaxID=3555 RepID=A0A0J8BAI2_BETVV|nr:hypothetical protein BVRB_4g097300 [Beta vulgaris subsp. vulgaris]